MRQFYLHPRNRIYYVQFVDKETKHCLSARSTGKDNRDEALLVVHDWLGKGIPPVNQTKDKPKPVSAHLEISQLISGLKDAALSAQDVVKIEKILKDKGLISIIVRKDSPGAELFEDFLVRFWDYDRSPAINSINGETGESTLSGGNIMIKEKAPVLKKKTGARNSGEIS